MAAVTGFYTVLLLDRGVGCDRLFVTFVAGDTELVGAHPLDLDLGRRIVGVAVVAAQVGLVLYMVEADGPLFTLVLNLFRSVSGDGDSAYAEKSDGDSKSDEFFHFDLLLLVWVICLRNL